MIANNEKSTKKREQTEKNEEILCFSIQSTL